MGWPPPTTQDSPVVGQGLEARKSQAFPVPQGGATPVGHTANWQVPPWTTPAGRFLHPASSTAPLTPDTKPAAHCGSSTPDTFNSVPMPTVLAEPLSETEER